MRAREFIVEYKQDLTARQFGPQLLNRIKQFGHPDYRWITSPMNHAQFYDPQTKQWDDARLLKAMFREFEDADPTYDSVNVKGGLYVPWIAREYAKGNIRRFEDLDSRVKPMLADYHKYKNRKDFWEPMPEIKDIMRVDFDHLEEYVGRYEPAVDDRSRGTANTVFEDDTVRIIVPRDQEAACYYGQGTRWCTAATKGTNYFNHYNRDGPLYILLPKQPQHNGEKYQLHFPSDQYMDENDDPVNIAEILGERFPGALEFFKKTQPELEEMVIFAPDETLEKIFHTVADYALEVAYEITSEWEVNDDYFSDYQFRMAKEKEYFTPEYLERIKQIDTDEEDIPNPEWDDIDWDRAYDDEDIGDYAAYNDNVGELISTVQGYTEIPAKNIRYYAGNYDSPDGTWTIFNLEGLVANCIREDAGRDIENAAAEIKDQLDHNVVIRSRFTKDGAPRVDKPNHNRSWRVIDTTDKYEVGVMGPLPKKPR